MITRLMASHWLAQLTLLTICVNPIRLLIATKILPDFGDATFTFKIDPVFKFEMTDTIQT